VIGSRFGAAADRAEGGVVREHHRSQDAADQHAEPRAGTCSVGLAVRGCRVAGSVGASRTVRGEDRSDRQRPEEDDASGDPAGVHREPEIVRRDPEIVRQGRWWGSHGVISTSRSEWIRST
jgi:hypothetical protein